MHAMAEWYMRGEHHDQSRLSRILDVAQDLKVSRPITFCAFYFTLFDGKRDIPVLYEVPFITELIYFQQTFFFLTNFQALSMLLNATPFAFVIDLACLASRREYLKLDKWLSDKIREHGVSRGSNEICCGNLSRVLDVQTFDLGVIFVGAVHPGVCALPQTSVPPADGRKCEG